LNTAVARYALTVDPDRLRGGELTIYRRASAAHLDGDAGATVLHPPSWAEAPTSLELIRAHRFAIGGYACPFNQVSVRAGGVLELVKRGAFARAIAAGVVFLFVDHSDGAPTFASMHDATLHVEEDRYGLWFEAQLREQPDGARLMDAVRRRELAGVSTGVEFEHAQTIDGIRVVTEAALWEISLLTVRPSRRPARVATWVRPNAEAQRERLRIRFAPW